MKKIWEYSGSNRIHNPSHEEDSSHVPVPDEEYERVVCPEHRDWGLITANT